MTAGPWFCAWHSEVSRRLFGALRVGGVLAVFLVLSGGLLLRNAEGQVRERLRGLGAELFEWSALAPDSGIRTLTVNGLSLRLLTLSSDRGVQAALDEVGSVGCEGAGIRIGSANDVRIVFDGILRHESEREGMLACLDTGGPLDPSQLRLRLAGALKSGDLGDLGQLRFAFARHQQGRTSTLVLFTEGPAELGKAFPRRGDAPGADLPGVPRAPELRRRLSAGESSASPGLTLYSGPGEPAALVAWYARALTEGSWIVTPNPDSARLRATRDGRHLFLRATPQREGTGVLLMVVEL